MAVPKKRSNVQDRNAAKQLIRDAELMREQGEPEIAAGMLQTAFFLALKMDDDDLAADSGGHLLVCYKLAEEMTRNTQYAVFGVHFAESCMAFLDVPDPVYAVFSLRKGDFYTLLDDYSEAEPCYQEAIKLAGRRNKARYAEYLGHLGLCQAINKKEIGLANLMEAEELIRKDKSLREFHRLTVLCGILMRKASAAAALGKKNMVKPALLEAAALAKTLKEQHHMPVRFAQVREATKRLGVRL